MYKIATFLFLQNKRLLSKFSFIVVLLIIPIFAFSMKLFFQEDSGIYKVALCTRQKEDEDSQKIIDKLMNSESVLQFVSCESEEEAEKLVRSGKSDAAWIFMPDLEARMRDYCQTTGHKKPLVTILQRDESVVANISHEKLYGSMFPEITYLTFENFLLENFPELHFEQSDIQRLYDSTAVNGSLVAFDYLEERATSTQQTDFLQSPVYGLLAVMTVVCGLAAQMLFLSDKKRGVFDWLSGTKQMLAGIGITFVAVFDGAVTVFVSLLLTGNVALLRQESVSLLCLIMVSVAFCVLVGTLISSGKTLGICLPFLTLLLLFLSPIFINIYRVRAIAMMFPVYYYLYSFHSAKYILFGVFYVIAAFLLAFLADYIKRRFHIGSH